eukprot:scaffold67345_cov23-Tisochrysis_lutea.AAC.1
MLKVCFLSVSPSKGVSSMRECHSVLQVSHRHNRDAQVAGTRRTHISDLDAQQLTAAAAAVL